MDRLPLFTPFPQDWTILGLDRNMLIFTTQSGHPMFLSLMMKLSVFLNIWLKLREKSIYCIYSLRHWFWCLQTGTGQRHGKTGGRSDCRFCHCQIPGTVWLRCSRIHWFLCEIHDSCHGQPLISRSYPNY